MPLSSAERARYSRHLVLGEVNRAGQERLKAARVLVVGAGGLGSPAALYLAAAGVGTLGLVDHDCVEISNLQRQVLFGTSDIGRAKVDAACERLTALNPEIRVVAHNVELVAGNALELSGHYDIVLDGSDRLSTRYVVNDACVIGRKPLVSAAIHRFEGQAMTYVPGRGPCYRCLFPEVAGSEVPNCAEAGVLGVLPGVLGIIQATEVTKLILGVGDPLIGRLLTYDALELRFREFSFSRQLDCVVCGEHPSITAPVDNRPQRSTGNTDRPTAGLRQMSPHALHALLGAAQRPGAGPAGRTPCVVDVREMHEFRAGHIADAMHIPLGEIEVRVLDIPRDAVVIFVCRSGARSAAACALAAQLGLSESVNLDGGMLAWADQVDSTINVV